MPEATKYLKRLVQESLINEVKSIDTVLQAARFSNNPIIIPGLLEGELKWLIACVEDQRL